MRYVIDIDHYSPQDPTVIALCTDCLELMSCEEMEISYDLGKKIGDGDVPIQDDDDPTDAVQVDWSV